MSFWSELGDGIFDGIFYAVCVLFGLLILAILTGTAMLAIEDPMFFAVIAVFVGFFLVAGIVGGSVAAIRWCLKKNNRQARR